MSDLTESIQARYAEESLCDSVLGCGRVIEMLKLQPGERVLDLGCGRGYESLEAAVLVGPSGLVVGLDLTEEMVAVAARNAREKGIDNVRFVAGDIEKLVFGDNSFSAVQSNCVINHARDKPGVFREIYRVLKPGGRFVIADAVSRLPLPDYIKNDPLQRAACFGGAVTEAEYLHSVETAGFRRIDILHRREYVKNGFDFVSLTIQALK